MVGARRPAYLVLINGSLRANGVLEMKKTVSTLVIAAAALAASPAFAQASGTVQMTGSVAAKCTAIQPIAGSIDLGELAKDDGTVDQAFSKAKNGLTTNFTVRCNGSNAQLSVEAKPLINTAATQAEGYANTVHYKATLAAQTAAGNTSSVADQSISAGAAMSNVAGKLKAAANNVTLTIGEGATQNSTAILEAGTYNGSVDVTITAAI